MNILHKIHSNIIRLIKKILTIDWEKQNLLISSQKCLQFSFLILLPSNPFWQEELNNPHHISLVKLSLPTCILCFFLSINLHQLVIWSKLSFLFLTLRCLLIVLRFLFKFRFIVLSIRLFNFIVTLCHFEVFLIRLLLISISHLLHCFVLSFRLFYYPTFLSRDPRYQISSIGKLT